MIASKSDHETAPLVTHTLQQLSTEADMHSGPSAASILTVHDRLLLEFSK